jgi:hypothetical protein
LIEKCTAIDAVASTWVDDLVFSGSETRNLMEPTRKLFADHGFILSAAKREVLGPRDTKEITGIRLGGEMLRAPRRKLSDIRAGIHKIKLGVIAEENLSRYVAQLCGRLQHVIAINPKDGLDLFLELQMLCKGRHRIARHLKPLEKRLSGLASRCPKSQALERKALSIDETTDTVNIDAKLVKPAPPRIP